MCDVFNTYSQTLTLNKATYSVLNGEDYAIVPINLIVEGVLNGSQGAIYYPLSEMASNPDDWNGVPLVLNHPQQDGKYISARQVEVIEKYGLGYIFNTRIDGNKLVADGWFNIEKVRNTYPQLLNNLENGIATEVSTGLIPTLQRVAGNFKGKEYQAIATNFRPDHLAILPDDVGACSLKDGCGIFNKVTSKPFNLTNKELINMPLTNQQKEQKASFIIANCSSWKEEDKETLSNLSDEQITRLETGVQNTLAAKSKEEAEEDKGMTPQQIEELVNKAITKHISNSSPENNEQKEVPEEVKPVENKEEAKPSTLEDWFKSAPSEVQEVFNSAQSLMNQKKAELIKKITANVDEDKKEAVVNTLVEKSNEELEFMASLVPDKQEEVKPVSNAEQIRQFIGAGAGQPLNNSKKSVGSPLLPMVLNYDED